MGKIYIKGNYGFLERHLFSLVTSHRVEALSALPNILYVLIGNKHQKCDSERERKHEGPPYAVHAHHEWLSFGGKHLFLHFLRSQSHLKTSRDNWVQVSELSIMRNKMSRGRSNIHPWYLNWIKSAPLGHRHWAICRWRDRGLASSRTA